MNVITCHARCICTNKRVQSVGGQQGKPVDLIIDMTTIRVGDFPVLLQTGIWIVAVIHQHSKMKEMGAIAMSHPKIATCRTTVLSRSF